MFIATNNIKVKKGHALEVAERFRQPKGITHSPGFIKMEVLLSTTHEEHDELGIRTTWESEQHFLDWTNSEAFRGAHKHSDAARPAPGIMLGSYLTTQQFLFENAKQAIEVK